LGQPPSHKLGLKSVTKAAEVIRETLWLSGGSVEGVEEETETRPH
jgi:hypothetical protein